MVKKEQMLFVTVFAASLFFFVSAAAAFETKPTVPVREPIKTGLQKQLKSPYTVSYAPQQFYIEYLFENPSGKGWWRGNTLATITISRQDNSPSCRKYDVIRLMAGQAYVLDLPNVCSFTKEFKNIPVFNEVSIRATCSQVLPASINNATTTRQEKVEISARYWKSTGGSEWETVAVVPITANLRCERELKPHK
jgi:hypothetical protein